MAAERTGEMKEQPKQSIGAREREWEGNGSGSWNVSWTNGKETDKVVVTSQTGNRQPRTDVSNRRQTISDGCVKRETDSIGGTC